MIIAAEFPLNRHESFRAEISDSSGILVVSIGRWKTRANGSCRRAGPTFEFAAHRLDAVSDLLANVQRVVAAHKNQTHVKVQDRLNRRASA